MLLQCVQMPKLYSAIIDAKLSLLHAYHAMALSSSSISLHRIFHAFLSEGLFPIVMGGMSQEVCALLVLQSCQCETKMIGQMKHIFLLT